MRILGIETSTEVGSVAILEDGARVTERVLRAPMKLLSWLSQAISDILRETDLSLENIDAIATGIGPGSFTGVRLEIATARALAQVRKIPLYGISSLDALAYQSLLHQGTIVSIIDARRGEIFAAIYEASEAALKQVGDSLCFPKEKVLEKVSGHPGPYCFIGETNPDPSFFLTHLSNSRQADPDQGFPRASSIARLAHDRRHVLSGDLYSVQPLYIRASQAEIEREKRATKS